jgi:dimethylamine monooxygenase subunit A
MSERRRWLESDPPRYAALLPDGIPVLDATLKSAAALQTIDEADRDFLRNASDPLSRCLSLGKLWEPDFALLRLDSSGKMILVGGCICFPSNWRLTDKIGQPLDCVHEIVPGLNIAIGASIDTLLAHMKPYGTLTRSNWSMCRTPELNQHPDRHLPALSADCTLDDVWLRIEDQALVSLADAGGLLFGIRLRHIPFRELLRNAVASQRLREAIETMPREMVRYKGLTSIRDRLVQWLATAG